MSEGQIDTETQRRPCEDGADIGAMHLQAKERRGLLAATRRYGEAQHRFRLSLSSLADTSISDFWPLKL